MEVVNSASKLFSRNAIPNNSNAYQFKITTYNILADKWCKVHNVKEIGNEKKTNWDLRSERLHKELVAFDSDILCLQEMEAQHFSSFFQPKLADRGYTGIMQEENDKPKDVGVATFFKKSKFTLDWVQSKSRALLTGLRLNHPSDAEFPIIIDVANVHLEGNPVKVDTRFSQIKSVLSSLQERSQQTKDKTFFSLICGDFNCTEESQIYSLIKTGVIRAFATDEKSKNVYTDKEWQHQLQMRSAYAAVNSNHEPSFTFACSKTMPIKTLDFMWFGSRSGTGIEAVGALKVTEDEEDTAEILKHFMPSFVHPSDHLPLMFQFDVSSSLPTKQ